MTLADDLSAISSRKLTLDEIIDALDEPDREALLTVLRDKTRPASAIAGALTRNGFPMSRPQVAQWRRNDDAR